MHMPQVCQEPHIRQSSADSLLPGQQDHGDIIEEEAALQGHSPQTTDAGHTIQNVTMSLRQGPSFVLEPRAAQTDKSPVATYHRGEEFKDLDAVHKKVTERSRQ